MITVGGVIMTDVNKEKDISKSKQGKVTLDEYNKVYFMLDYRSDNYDREQLAVMYGLTKKQVAYHIDKINKGEYDSLVRQHCKKLSEQAEGSLLLIAEKVQRELFKRDLSEVSTEKLISSYSQLIDKYTKVKPQKAKEVNVNIFGKLKSAVERISLPGADNIIDITPDNIGEDDE
jgi:hypothetical protein